MIVSVRGSGVAAATCSRLLAGSGVAVSRSGSERQPVPSIMLQASALALLRDVHGRADLFAGYPRVTRRIVAWGGSDPVVLPHDAILVSEADLQRELTDDGPQPDGAVADFTIHATAPLPEGTNLRFGAREAVAVPVVLRGDARSDECRMEAVAGGWLFLVPADDRRGYLLVAGEGIDALLRQSRLIAPVIEICAEPGPGFACAPRMASVLAGSRWLACGSAALGFDPICGDGTAQAVREALLAAAVLRAIAAGQDVAPLLAHYRAMLVAAMRRHLQLCAPFYRSGGDGAWWREQEAGLSIGFDACTRFLATQPEPRFVLRGTMLEPRAQAA